MEDLNRLFEQHANSLNKISDAWKKAEKEAKENLKKDYENRRRTINEKLNKLRKEEQDLVQAAMDNDNKMSADFNDIVRQREKVTSSAIRELQNA